MTPIAGFRRDVMRWSGAKLSPSPAVTVKLTLANPGVQAALLLRTQLALQQAGHHRLAQLASLINLRVTGAEFVVGCCVGPGLVMRHPQGVVIGSGAVLGSDCTILHGVTLGERYGDGADDAHGYPRLGSRVVIGAGAVLLGDIAIGDDAVVGANSVVLDDVAASETVGGVPARPLRRSNRPPISS